MEKTRESGRWDPNVPYGECPDPALGAMDGKGRSQRLDKEGLKAAIIYPTLALQWETECDDADYAQAMCRAYNRAVLDWCSKVRDVCLPPRTCRWAIRRLPRRNWSGR